MIMLVGDHCVEVVEPVSIHDVLVYWGEGYWKLCVFNTRGTETVNRYDGRLPSLIFSSRPLKR